MTPALMLALDLFEFRADEDAGNLVIFNVSDEENWRGIKEMLIMNVGMNSVPIIKITDSLYGKNGRTLLLEHEYRGRELDLNFAEETLVLANSLWGNEVMLRTVSDGQPMTFSCNEGYVELVD